MAIHFAAVIRLSSILILAAMSGNCLDIAPPPLPSPMATNKVSVAAAIFAPRPIKLTWVPYSSNYPSVIIEGTNLLIPRSQWQIIYQGYGSNLCLTPASSPVFFSAYTTSDTNTF